MNLEQLQALSDAELNELAAVKVMGWINKGTDHRGITLWMEKDNPDHYVHFTYDGALDWNPTTDMNDAMELLKGQEYSLMNSGGIKAQIFKRNGEGKTIFHVISTTLPRAITIASILAFE